MNYLVITIGGEECDKTFCLSPQSVVKLAHTPLADMMAFCEKLQMPEGGPYPVASSEEVDVEIAPLMCDPVEHEEFVRELLAWHENDFLC